MENTEEEGQSTASLYQPTVSWGKGGTACRKYNYKVISQPGFGLNTIALFFPEIPNSTLLKLIFLMQIAERQKTLDQGIKAHFFRVFRAFHGLKTF